MRSARPAVARVAVGCCLFLLGCQALGPATLAAGRGAYNDVIAQTSAEQTLGLIVRLRYSDPVGLLTVASVTASLKFSASARGEADVGSESAYQGAIVPISAGIAYEDSPTISYTPIEGQAFLREWLAPLSIETLAAVMQEARRIDALFPLLVEKMNRLRSGPEASADEREGFARAATLFAELRHAGVANWVGEAGAPTKFELELSQYAPAHVDAVNELLRILDVDRDTRTGDSIHLPVKLAASRESRGVLALQTRSTAGILRAVADLVEVPAKDVAAGVVTPDESTRAAGGAALRILSSESAPHLANVAIEYRGSWFYVSDTDLAGKALFQASRPSSSPAWPTLRGAGRALRS